MNERPAVLLVDDEPEILVLLSEYLGSEGFDVVQAKDGIDALSCLYARTPKMVLVDLMMPRMNGIELITQMRNDRRLSGVRIVAMSAAPALLPTARASGADEVIAKPIDCGMLLRLLNAS